MARGRALRMAVVPLGVRSAAGVYRMQPRWCERGMIMESMHMETCQGCRDLASRPGHPRSIALSTHRRLPRYNIAAVCIHKEAAEHALQLEAGALRWIHVCMHAG